MAQPKCPSCSIEGIEKIISEDSKKTSQRGDPWFNVVFCENCGYVYGIFAKHVLSHDMTLKSKPYI